MSWRWPMALIGALALAIFVFTPRHPDLRAFVPAQIAEIETASWRHYYERNYVALPADLYRLSATQFHFSPWQSATIAFNAARAAGAFADTRNRSQAANAIPALRAYFSALIPGTRPFDIDAAARAELDWWQARREGESPNDYGARIARVTAMVYGVDNSATRRAGMLRAQAMHERDVRGTAITEDDWTRIERLLEASYALLKRGVTNAF